MSDSFTPPDESAGPVWAEPIGPGRPPAPDHPAPPRKPRRSNRKPELVAGLVAVAVVICGVFLVTENDSAGLSSQPLPSTSGLSQSTGSPSPYGSPTALPEAATCVSSLTACLVPAPSGSTPMADSWGRSPSAETVSQYLDYFYSAQSATARGRVKARLSDDGETAIVKRTWTLSDGEQVDDELLSFATENGAESWFDSDSTDESGTPFTVPGGLSVQGYNRTKDADGVAWSIVYGYSDSTAMEIWVEKSGRNDDADADSLTPIQMQAIENHESHRVVPVASSPSAAPFSPTNNGSAACVAGQIDSCLLPRPAGAVVWTGDPYYAETDVTIEQYVDDMWSAAEQSNMIQIFNTAGVQKIAHRDWITTTDHQVDVSVLQYDSVSDAQSQDVSFQQVLGGASFRISGLSAEGGVHTMDSSGDVDVEISGDSGPYQLVVNSFSPSSADVADAVQVFEQDYNLLPNS